MALNEEKTKLMVKNVNVILAKKGISKKDFFESCGISSASFSQWNTGRTCASMKAVYAIAGVLGVDVEELIGEEETETPAPQSSADELISYLQELKDRPEMKMLFHATKNASKEQIMNIVNMIEGFKGES